MCICTHTLTHIYTHTIPCHTIPLHCIALHDLTLHYICTYSCVSIYIDIYREREGDTYTLQNLNGKIAWSHTDYLHMNPAATGICHCQLPKIWNLGATKPSCDKNLFKLTPNSKTCMYIYVYIYIYYSYISIHRCMFIRMWRQSISLFSRQPLRSPLKGARTKFHTVLTKHELSSWGYPNSWMGKNWKFLLSMNDGPGYPPMTMETSIWENIPY